MEGVRENVKLSKIILAVALLAFVVLAAGCVQTGQEEQAMNKSSQAGGAGETPGAPPGQQLEPEFGDGLDAALQELEQTR